MLGQYRPPVGAVGPAIAHCHLLSCQIILYDDHPQDWSVPILKKLLLETTFPTLMGGLYLEVCTSICALGVYSCLYIAAREFGDWLID